MEGELGFQGKEGLSPASRVIPASLGCLCLSPFVPNMCPRGSFPYCSLIALLRKQRGLVNEYQSHRALRLRPGAAGRPCPRHPAARPAAPRLQPGPTQLLASAWSIPAHKSHFGGCWKPLTPFHPAHDHKANPDICTVAPSTQLFAPLSPAVCPPPLPQIQLGAFSSPSPLTPLPGPPQVPGPERGGAGRPRGGAGLAAGGSGGDPGSECRCRPGASRCR